MTHQLPGPSAAQTDTDADNTAAGVRHWLSSMLMTKSACCHTHADSKIQISTAQHDKYWHYAEHAGKAFHAKICALCVGLRSLAAAQSNHCCNVLAEHFQSQHAPCAGAYLQTFDQVFLASLDNFAIFTRDVMLLAQALRMREGCSVLS